MRKTILFVAFALIIWGNLTWAGTIRIPDSVETIGQALAYHAQPGDTVLVMGGIHPPVNLSIDGVVLKADPGSGPVIDGENAGPCVTISGDVGASTVLDGFTIQNGSGTVGAGIYCMASPTIRDNTIIHNIASDRGGGIYILNGDPEIYNNIITENSAANGAGIDVFSGNPYIHSNTISSNTATENGGGILAEIGKVVISGNSLTGNTAMRGGGVYTAAYDPPLISSNFFNNNTALLGGAIFAKANDTIEYNTIVFNQAVADPAWGDSAAGGGIFIDEYINAPVIRNNIIEGNSSDSVGGGMTCRGGNDPKVLNTIFRNNSATYSGGAIQLIFNNLEANMCVFWGNAAPVGPQIHQWGSPVSQLASPYTAVQYSNVQGGWPGIGNIDQDPLFRDTADGDYRLMAISCGDPYDSPLIDAGDPAATDDILDCDHGLGTILADMGCFGGSNMGMPLDADDGPDLPTLPDVAMLSQNYPNPFNPSTRIEFELPRRSHVSLTIFNVLGQVMVNLANGDYPAGRHQIIWDGKGAGGVQASSGIYFYRLTTDGSAKTKKMLMLK